MPTACIIQPDCRVSLKSERIEVFGFNEQTQRDEVLRQIPLRDLERLVVAESVQVTSQALAALLRAEIPVSVLGWNGQFLGGFLPAGNAHGRARLQQYRRTQEADFALRIAGRIVTAKLYNQRRVLQRLGASRADVAPASTPASTPASSGGIPAARHESGQGPGCRQAGAPENPQTGTPAPPTEGENPKSELQSTLKWMDALFAPVSVSRTVDELRGYEGASTARYFQAWAGFLPAEFPFERRSTRPPLNPVNACISFGSTLLYHEAVAFLHSHGLDPALGTLHSTEDGRWSLALDLMEPFRPVLVEALSLDLFSHEILKGEHFEPKNGGVYLNNDGRKKFFLQYERRMERQFMSECAGHRTTLRQQLENQSVMFKAALDDLARFEPFLIN
ncbi:MAG TPA: CRISPR-associated endonuclease Cas1 [Haliangiales bacterium]|nr:CRISPR-associated endonuclease Cas1 [Haliangiales bacterium]